MGPKRPRRAERAPKAKPARPVVPLATQQRILDAFAALLTTLPVERAGEAGSVSAAEGVFASSSSQPDTGTDAIQHSAGPDASPKDFPGAGFPDANASPEDSVKAESHGSPIEPPHVGDTPDATTSSPPAPLALRPAPPTAPPASKPTPTSSPPSAPASVPAREALPSAAQRISPAALAALRADVQAVKAHLFARAFDQAFDTDVLRRAYALRWSPTRALAYLDLLRSGTVGAHVRSALVDTTSVTADEHSAPCCCLGAGAGAELAALAEVWRGLRTVDDTSSAEGAMSLAPLRLALVDVADWSGVLGALDAALDAQGRRREQEQEKQPLLATRFTQQDLLAPLSDGAPGASPGALVQGARLVTLFFVLNELYASSRARATALLLQLGPALLPGALLLVADSAGDYACVEVGGGGGTTAGGKSAAASGPPGDGAKAADAPGRTYPMAWLLDHTLLRGAGGTAPLWEKLHEDAARWFRVPPGLKYPLELENMRYQVHLYRRV